MSVRLLSAWLLLMLVPVLAVAGDTDPFGFADDAYSAWGIVGAPYPFDPAADTARPAGYGCFPVGNGLAFGHLGVDGDFTTLRGVMGPGYQSRNAAGKAEYWQPGVWPDLRPRVMQLDADGIPAPLPEWSSQSIEQLRGAALVRTIQRSHAIDLFVMTYAVPGEAVIVQEFVLFANPEMQPVLTLELPGAEANDKGQPYLNHGPDRLTVRGFGHASPLSIPPTGAFTMQVFETVDTQVEVAFTPDASGVPGLFRASLAYSFSSETGTLPEVDPHQDVLVGKARDWWRDWSAGNHRFDTGDALLDDMLTQLPVIIETQRDHYSGGVAPMVSYHGYWVRDSLGPILCDLDNGRFNEVMRMLRYHRAACRHYGHCHMLVPLDLDLSGLDGWLPGQPGSVGCLSGVGTERGDWEGVGVERAEVPSLIVLQHYLLWRAMHQAGEGDIADEFISEAWAFITHNLLTMNYDPAYGVPFHGDETYTHGSLYSTYDREGSGKIGYPNGYIPTDFFSADNTMLHRAAASAWLDMAVSVLDLSGDYQPAVEDSQRVMAVLEDMTRILGVQYGVRFGAGGQAISPVTHERFDSPFANIMLRPGWLGLDYGPAGETEWWQEAKDTLWHDPLPLTTPDSGYMTGHALGYWLSAATSNGDEYFAELALDRLLSTATPEGAWCEVLDPEGNPVEIYDRVNRIRPWESGVNYHAIVEALEPGRPWLNFDPGQQQWEPEPREYGGRAAPFPFTEVLALTVSDGCRDRLREDIRFQDTDPERIRLWDAGLPFSVADLRTTLLGENIVLMDKQQNPADGLLIPYLYFDNDVRGGLDRRTFKDGEFWNGEEMAQLLADYEATGGTVLTPETLDYRLAEGEVVALRMLVVLCTDTFTHKMTPEEISNFHHEVAQWIGWYDDVAGDRLHLELDYLQIDQHLTPRMAGPMGDGVYWMGYEDAAGLLDDRGITDGTYDSVAFFWGWSREFAWPDGTKARQAYGGAAQGPGSDMAFLGGPGETSYFGSAVLADRPGGPSKTALHEYLHNLDAMFEYIGDERLFHPDHMSRNMETLLSEVPGGFEQWGYTDDEVREMVEAELRNEIHFPWPTQLVYYEQALLRIPRAEYGALLKNFGTRAPRQPRERLYEHFILPEGCEPYQVYFTEYDGLEHVIVEEYDFVNKDHRLWANDLWCGLPREEDFQPACLYRELSPAGPDVIDHVLGSTFAGLELGVAAEDATVWAEVNGERVDMVPGEDGKFIGNVPDSLGESNDLVYHIDAPGYVCTDMPVELMVRPPWTVDVEWATQVGEDHGIKLRVNGPAKQYGLHVLCKSRFSTIQRMLCDDGLLREVDAEAIMSVATGYDAMFSSSVDPWEFQTCPLTVTVTDTSVDPRGLSYEHYFPATASPSSLIKGVAEEDLPSYVLKAYPVRTGIGIHTNSFKGFALTPENAHVFTGTVDDEDDAALYIGFGYSKEGLLVAGLIKDDALPANGTWDSDRLNLVFDAELNSTEDTYPDGPVGHSSWERDDYWVFLLPFQPDGPQTMRLGGEKPNGGVGYYGSVEGTKTKVSEVEGGYSIEWTIPWDQLPYLDNPQPGDLVGFTVFYSDYDDSLAELMYLTDWGGPDGIEWRFWDTGLLYFAE